MALPVDRASGELARPLLERWPMQHPSARPALFLSTTLGLVGTTLILPQLVEASGEPLRQEPRPELPCAAGPTLA